jgi:putative membrane protein
VITTATSRIKADFRGNRLLQVVTAAFAGLWIVAAIAPSYRFDWFLENLLVFGVVILLGALYRFFPLSDLSYLLLAVFLSLHTIGAHYTYSETPVGFWLQETFSLARNPYDRIVHLFFGLLVTYPLLEVVVRAARVRGLWAYFLAFCLKVALSSTYEVIEWTTMLVVDPDLGAAFLGAQGDEFDAQKDTALAAVGAVMCLVLAGRLHGRIAPPSESEAARG